MLTHLLCFMKSTKEQTGTAARRSSFASHREGVRELASFPDHPPALFSTSCNSITYAGSMYMLPQEI
jgi:hypothetical protein